MVEDKQAMNETEDKQAMNETEDKLVMEDARTIVELARKLAPHVNKNTYILGLDRSGRIATHAVREALKLQGAELPRLMHFINFSSRDLIAVGKNLAESPPVPYSTQSRHFKFKDPADKKNLPLLIKYIKKHMSIPKDTKNILIVDEFVETGHTFTVLKKAFKAATGKNTLAVALFGTKHMQITLQVLRPDWFSSPWMNSGQR